jgi:hypothetical protein
MHRGGGQHADPRGLCANTDSTPRRSTDNRRAGQLTVMPGASEHTRKVSNLNANWVAGPEGTDGRCEVLIVTDDGPQHFFGEAKPVADLCHAPLVLAAAGALNGRKTAAYPALAPDVASAGAEFVDSDAVVDGVVVSAQAWPAHPGWIRLPPSSSPNFFATANGTPTQACCCW